MHLLNKILPIVFLVTLYSCKDKQSNPVKYEINVMAEIAPSLIDSMWIEIVYSMRPPLIETDDSANQQSEKNPIEQEQIRKTKLRAELAEHKRNVYPINIVISDSVQEIYWKEDLAHFNRHFQTATIDTTNKSWNTRYKIDLSKFKVDKVYNLILESEFIKQKHDHSEEYIISTLSFSRFVLDSEKVSGMFLCEFEPGPIAGADYAVFLKKVNNKWLIDKIEMLRVA